MWQKEFRQSEKLQQKHRIYLFPMIKKFIQFNNKIQGLPGFKTVFH